MKVSDISVEYVDSMGSDLSVVNAARVSFAKESEWDDADIITGSDEHGAYEQLVYKLKESDTKLIEYLAKHKHYSPFNHTFLTFRIKAPIFVARQLVKHEYLPWNEVSRRYVDSEPEFYPLQFRLATENVKQGSGAAVDELTQKKAAHIFWSSVDHALETYYALLAMGICKEQARAVLPVSQTTEWIWSGTLKAFHKMLSLRLDNHTQYETRIVAEKILDLIHPYFPISLEALLNESE